MGTFFALYFDLELCNTNQYGTKAIAMDRRDARAERKKSQNIISVGDVYKRRYYKALVCVGVVVVCLN